MKGALLIATLIAMLIVGVLVAKNMTTDVDDGADRMETIQKARETAREVETQAQELQDRLREATRGMEDTR